MLSLLGRARASSLLDRAPVPVSLPREPAPGPAALDLAVAAALRAPDGARASAA